ncbi:MAG: hypothetical protein K9I85_02440 [Saprospiraceae bacterium]|nr:hypothetical protein [Saprospiraceae bacterium]
MFFCSFVLLFFCSLSCSLRAQIICNIPMPTPPEGVTLQQVGSDFGVSTLSQAIALGKMYPPPSPSCPTPYPMPIQWIFISGTFTIDAVPSCGNAYVFGSSFAPLDQIPDSRIFMAPNARIEVSSGPNFLFNINWTQIQGCDEMWEHIRVNPGSRHVISNSWVRDGIHAYALEPNAEFTIRHCLFKNNLFGVWFDPSGSHAGTLFSCRNSTFAGINNGLKSPYPNYFNTAYVGIEVNNKPNVFDIGSNVFENIQNGIIANQSCIHPTSQPYNWGTNVFRNVRPAGATIANDFGNGILINGDCNTGLSSNLSGGNHTYTGFGYAALNYSSNFDNCLRGIHLLDSRVFVFGNDMVVCDTAILVKSTPSTKPSRFEMNAIAASRDIGMCFLDNGFGYKANIEDNEIDIFSPIRSWGIYINGSLSPHQISIGSNKFDIHTEGTGVDLDAVETVRIRDENKFNVTGTGYDYIGVQANFGSVFTQILDNDFNGQDQNGFNPLITPNRAGIIVNGASDAWVRCNHFDNVAMALDFESYCVDSDVRSNRFISGTDGLVLGAHFGGAVTGEQTINSECAANEWPTSLFTDFYVNMDAKSWNPTFFENDLSKFWIDQMDQSGNNNVLWPDKIQAVAPGWFQDDPNVVISPAQCTNNLIDPNGDDELTSLDQGLINGTLDFDEEYYNWRSRWHLLDKLEANPDLLIAFPSSVTWQQGMFTTPQGQMWMLMQDIRSARSMSATDEATLQNIALSSEGVQLQLDILDSLWIVNGTLTGIEALQYDSLASILTVNSTQALDLLTDWQLNLATEIDLAHAQLNVISPVSLMDVQFHSTLNIWLGEVLHPFHTIQPASLSQLKVLADGCLWVDGLAVPFSRSVLRSLGMNQPALENAGCSFIIEESLTMRSDKVDEGNWTVHPSVTQHYCRLNYTGVEVGGEVRISAYNMAGVPVLYQESNAKSVDLDFGGFPSGTYMIQVVREGMDPVQLPVIKQ